MPQTKLVVTTVAARDEEMFAALRAGADGYLLMTMSPGRLGYALRGVARGEAALPRQMTAKLILEFRDRGTRRRLHVPATGAEIELTAREFEVLERLRRRQRTAEIAAELSISEVTVRRHVSSIMQKLGTHQPPERAADARARRASSDVVSRLEIRVHSRQPPAALGGVLVTSPSAAARRLLRPCPTPPVAPFGAHGLLSRDTTDSHPATVQWREREPGPWAIGGRPGRLHNRQRGAGNNQRATEGRRSTAGGPAPGAAGGQTSSGSADHRGHLSVRDRSGSAPGATS